MIHTRMVHSRGLISLKDLKMRKTTVAAKRKTPPKANFCLNSIDNSLMKISFTLMRSID